jgi:plastocyanin
MRGARAVGLVAAALGLVGPLLFAAPAAGVDTDVAVLLPGDDNPSGYFPDPVTITVGDTVNWTNADTVPHSVTSDDDGATFDTGADCPTPLEDCLQPGDSFAFTFESTGTFAYHCRVHPVGPNAMHGAIVVLAAPTTSSTTTTTAPTTTTTAPTTTSSSSTSTSSSSTTSSSTTSSSTSTSTTLDTTTTGEVAVGGDGGGGNGAGAALLIAAIVLVLGAIGGVAAYMVRNRTVYDEGPYGPE